MPFDPIMETNSIEVMRQIAILGDAITFLTAHDIDFERRAGRLTLVPVRELSARSQTLMLIGPRSRPERHRERHGREDQGGVDRDLKTGRPEDRKATSMETPCRGGDPALRDGFSG